MTGNDGDSRPNYHAHALTRGLQLLEAVAASKAPITLTELHEASALPKSTIVRLLSALAEAGYVLRVDERPSYVLGPSVMRLATPYLESLDLVDLVRDRLVVLAEATRQTVNLGVLDGNEVLHVAVVTPKRPLYYDASPGDRAAAYCTGLGKALLASLPEDEVSQHLPPLPWTEGRAGLHAQGPEELRSHLDRSRELGYAFDDNEFAEGLRCVAVRLPTVAVPAALSVSGPSGEFGEEVRDQFAALVRECAKDLATDPAVIAALEATPRRR